MMYTNMQICIKISTYSLMMVILIWKISTAITYHNRRHLRSSSRELAARWVEILTLSPSLNIVFRIKIDKSKDYIDLHMARVCQYFIHSLTPEHGQWKRNNAMFHSKYDEIHYPWWSIMKSHIFCQNKMSSLLTVPPMLEIKCTTYICIFIWQSIYWDPYGAIKAGFSIHLLLLLN